MTKIAIIVVRSSAGARQEEKDTLTMLRLRKKHACVVVDKTPSMMGMLNKVKDFTTYGEIDEETMKLLSEKRQKKEKLFFALHPPIGGYERKGIKAPYSIGGVLGYRGENINVLLKKMI